MKPAITLIENAGVSLSVMAAAEIVDKLKTHVQNVIRRSLVRVQPPLDSRDAGGRSAVARVLSCAFRLAQARCTFRESDDFDSTGIPEFG